MKKSIFLIPAFLFAKDNSLTILYKFYLLLEKFLFLKTFWIVYGIVFALLFLFGRYNRLSAVFFLKLLFYTLVLLSIYLSMQFYLFIFNKIPEIPGYIYMLIIFLPLLISGIVLYFKRNNKTIIAAAISFFLFLGGFVLYGEIENVKMLFLYVIILTALGLMVGASFYFVYLLKDLRWFKK